MKIETKNMIYRTWIFVGLFLWIIVRIAITYVKLSNGEFAWVPPVLWEEYLPNGESIIHMRDMTAKEYLKLQSMAIMFWISIIVTRAVSGIYMIAGYYTKGEVEIDTEPKNAFKEFILGFRGNVARITNKFKNNFKDGITNIKEEKRLRFGSVLILITIILGYSCLFFCYNTLDENIVKENGTFLIPTIYGLYNIIKIEAKSKKEPEMIPTNYQTI